MRQPALPFVLCATAWLAACAAPRPVEQQPEPTADYHLLMGEIALARGHDETALAEYLAAAGAIDDPGVARRATQVAVHVGDVAAAHRAADRWEQLAPGDIEMAQYQAVLHARRDERDAALGYLVTVAEGETGQATGANLQMITSMLATEPNRWRSAALMASLAGHFAQHAEGWHGAALLALEADRPEEAARLAGRALDIDPNHVDALFLRARAELAVAGPGARQALAPLAGFRNAADPGRRYRFAALLVAAGEVDEADALYEDILVNHPDAHDARVARALLAMDRGDFALAEEELHTLLERHGRVQDALWFLGVAAERRGALNDAIDWYARVAPPSPRWLDAQTAIGRVLMQLDGPEAVTDFFGELRQMWPEYELPLLLDETGLLIAGNEAGLALQLLDAAPESLARDAELRWQKALAAAEAGQLDRAEAGFKALLDEDPSNPLLENALGYLYLQQGDLGRAEKRLEAAYEAAPANAAILDSLGWLRFQQERFAEARALLEASWQRQPTVTTGLHLLTTLNVVDNVAAADFGAALRERFPQLIDKEVEQ